MTRYKKRAPCPGCSPDTKACFSADLEWDFETGICLKVWKCNNCYHTLPRRTNKRHRRLTPARLRSIRRILKLAKESLGGRNKIRFSRPVRIKFLEHSGLISLSFSMCPAGAKFGSPLYMVANVDFHIFIGSRGGVSNARTRRKGEHNAIWDCIIR